MSFAGCHFAECRNAECRYAECRSAVPNAFKKFQVFEHSLKSQSFLPIKTYLHILFPCQILKSSVIRACTIKTLWIRNLLTSLFVCSIRPEGLIL
jgi:hypothetical protein